MPLGPMTQTLLSGQNVMTPATQQKPVAPKIPQAQTPPPTTPEVDDLGGPLGHAALMALSGAVQGHAAEQPTTTPASPQEVPVQPTENNPWVIKKEVPLDFAGDDTALQGLAKLAQVPQEILELAERFPVAAKLIHNATVKENMAGSEKETSQAPAERTTVKEPVGHKFNNTTALPLPANHIHIRASDGSEFLLPSDQLGVAYNLDPNLTILRS